MINTIVAACVWGSDSVCGQCVAYKVWSKPPTPRMTLVMACCTRQKNSNSSCGSEAMTPIEPLTVPYNKVGIGRASMSGVRMTSEPARGDGTAAAISNAPRN